MSKRNHNNIYANINMKIYDKAAEGGALSWKR